MTDLVDALDEESIVDQLARNYARIAHLGLPRMRDEHPETIKNIHQAGEQLHRLGGVSAMQSATVKIFEMTDGQFSTGADFNRLWDGVGAWRA